MNFFKTSIYIFLFFSTLINIQAKDINPSYEILVSSSVSDILKNKNTLLISTKDGNIEEFHFDTKKLKHIYTSKKIKNFLGKEVNSKIYSIDKIDNKILVLFQGKKGARSISILENNKEELIISDEKRLFIAKAKFINKDFIIFATLSNEVYLYDIKKQKYVFTKQISASKFSDFTLNEKKDEAIIADESGNLHKISTSDGKLLKVYEKQNLDNVFQVSYKNNIILTAGQDRKAVVYNQGITYSKKVEFLIYACDLSPSGILAAIANDEDNNVLIFNTKNKKELFSLRGNKMTLNKILFINESEIFIASDDKKITYYNLKEIK